jgi:hypothetical protein
MIRLYTGQQLIGINASTGSVPMDWRLRVIGLKALEGNRARRAAPAR